MRWFHLRTGHDLKGFSARPVLKTTQFPPVRKEIGSVQGFGLVDLEQSSRNRVSVEIKNRHDLLLLFSLLLSLFPGNKTAANSMNMCTHTPQLYTQYNWTSGNVQEVKWVPGDTLKTQFNNPEPSCEQTAVHLLHFHIREIHTYCMYIKINTCTHE